MKVISWLLLLGLVIVVVMAMIGIVVESDPFGFFQNVWNRLMGFDAAWKTLFCVWAFLVVVGSVGFFLFQISVLPGKPAVILAVRIFRDIFMIVTLCLVVSAAYWIWVNG